MSEPNQPGTHAFSGSCRPMAGGFSKHATFSLGVFEWVPSASGGVKRGAVKVRVRGRSSNAEIVEREAARIAKELDNGTYSGPKRVTVGTV